MFKIRYLYIVASILFINCQKSTVKVEPLECGSNCDSLHKEFKNGTLHAIYTYKDGLRQGRFILFDEKDTLYGFHDYRGNYLKRTIEDPDGNYVIDLFILKDGKFKPSEVISYNSAGKIKLEESHYLNIIQYPEIVTIVPNLQGNYDSMYLYSANKVIGKASMIDGAINIDANSINEKKDLRIYVFSDLGKNQKGAKITKGFSFLLTRERLNEDFIRPYTGQIR